MNFSTFTTSGLLFAIVASGAPSVADAAGADDLTIISKYTQNGKPTGTATSYLASDHVRMARAIGSETIVDLQTGAMTTLDTKKKTYFTVTKQDIADYAAKVSEKMNTPEMKKAQQAMAGMSDAVAASFDVKKMGTSRKVAGFRCEEWTITIADMTTTKECLTTELRYPASAFEVYKQMSENMKGMMGAFAPAANAGAAEMAQKVKDMKGYPVATSLSTNMMGMKSTSESEVIEVRRGSIPASIWEVPAGYTKIENPMLKAFDGHGHRHP